jgi:GNAT superfamily N-acetyltransferase
MVNQNSAFKIRDAASGDVAKLSSIKPTEALHRDRIRDTDGIHLRYMVAEKDGTVVGFGLLVFEPPEAWPEMKCLPAIVDLYVEPEFRSQGIGTSMIREMEKIALERGCHEIFIGVNPRLNKRAHFLYLRLGYEPLQEEPYLSHWRFTTSAGDLYEGHEWIIDLRKDLRSKDR